MDLESITERFRCSQPLLHVEGVVMLRKMLVSAPTPPDAAYAFALRSLSSPHSSIAQPIVTLVEELVALGKLPLLKAFADLSDAVPSATGGANLHALLLGLLRLRQASGFVDKQPDPLVAVLETRKEASAYLLIELARQPVAVLLTKFLPLITRLLLSKNAALRTSVCAALVRMRAEDALKERLLVTVITSLRTHSSGKAEPEAILVPLDFVDLLCEGAASLAAPSAKVVYHALLQTLLELLLEAISAKDSVAPIVDRLTVLLNTKLAGSFATIASHLVFVTAYALSICVGPHDRESLVTLLQYLLERGGSVSFVSLSCAIGPLLELAAGPASALTTTATSLAASALAALARAPVESEPAALFDAHMHAVLGATQRTFRALSGHCKSAESWLAFADHLTVRLAAFSPSTHSLALLVFTVPAFILHAAGPVRDKGLALVRAIATAAPADALSLLPLLVNQLSRETVPAIQLACMQTIASLASYGPGAAAVYRSLRPLLESAELAPIALRLTVQLWKLHQRFWPRLHRTLEAMHKKIIGVNDSELRMSVAASLLDVCEHGAHHAPDIIAILSAMVSTPDKSPVSSSITIQALHKLCLADELDWRTCWQVIRGKVTTAEHPLVKAALLEFLSVATDDVRGKDLEAEAESAELSTAWDFFGQVWAGLRHPDGRVRCAALRSSGKFVQAVELTSYRYFTSRLSPSPIALAETLLSDSDDQVRVLAAQLLAIFAELEVSQRKSPQMSNTAATKGVVSKSLYDCKSYLTEAFMTRSQRPRLVGAKASAVLWIGANDATQATAARRLVQELVADVRAPDAETSVAQLSGWVECMTRAVGASVDEAADDAAETDKLAQLFLEDASRELQGASPAHTEASLISLGALGHALPSAGHAAHAKVHKFLVQQAAAHMSTTRAGAALGLGLLLSSPKHTPAASVARESAELITKLSDKADDPHEQFACFVALGLVAAALPPVADVEPVRRKIEHCLRSAASTALPFPAAAKSAAKVSAPAVAGALYGLGFLSTAFERAKETANISDLAQAVHQQVTGAGQPHPYLVLLDAHLLLQSLHLQLESAPATHAKTRELLRLRERTTDAGALAAVHSSVCHVASSLLARDDVTFVATLEEEAKWVQEHLAASRTTEERRAAALASSHLLGVGLLVPGAGSALWQPRVSSKVTTAVTPFAAALLTAVKEGAESDDSRLCAASCAVLGALIAADSRSVVGSSANFASGSSVVRQLFDLISATHTSLAGTFAMQALADVKSTKRLPAVEWAPVLRQFIQSATTTQAKCAAIRFLASHAQSAPVQEVLRALLAPEATATMNEAEHATLVVGLVRVCAEVGDRPARAAFTDCVVSLWGSLSHASRMSALQVLDETLKKHPTSIELRSLAFALTLVAHPSADILGGNADALEVVTQLGRSVGKWLADAVMPHLRERGHPASLSAEQNARVAVMCTVAAQLAEPKQALPLLVVGRTWCLSQALTPALAPLIDLVARSAPAAKVPQSWLMDSFAAIGLSSAPLAGIVYVERYLLHSHAPDAALVNDATADASLLPYATFRYCQARADKAEALAPLITELVPSAPLAPVRQTLIFALLALGRDVPTIDLCTRLLQ